MNKIEDFKVGQNVKIVSVTVESPLYLSEGHKKEKEKSIGLNGVVVVIDRDDTIQVKNDSKEKGYKQEWWYFPQDLEIIKEEGVKLMPKIQKGDYVRIKYPERNTNYNNPKMKVFEQKIVLVYLINDNDDICIKNKLTESDIDYWAYSPECVEISSLEEYNKENNVESVSILEKDKLMKKFKLDFIPVTAKERPEDGDQYLVVDEDGELYFDEYSEAEDDSVSTNFQNTNNIAFYLNIDDLEDLLELPSKEECQKVIKQEELTNVDSIQELISDNWGGLDDSKRQEILKLLSA